MNRHLAVFVLLVAVACGGDTPVRSSLATPTPGYEERIETWRANRLERLRQPDGWLSLAGLYWLEEGASTVGADPASDLVLPEGKAAASLGVLHRQGRQVRFAAAPGAEVTLDGEPVGEVEMQSGDGGAPTTLAHRSLIFFVIERGDRIGIRLKDLDSELRREFTGIDHFPVDTAWRLRGWFEPFDEPEMIPVPNITGDVNEQPSHGWVVFDIAGEEHALLPLGEPDGRLFLVFGDETNGDETYGGGRFLYTDPPDENNLLVVDFNKAYNPPCVFTPYATCPLPPAENRLPVRVEAGEKSFGAGH